MNKDLAVIQKISQAAKVVCRVLFVVCVVGASITLVAAITAAMFGTGELFSIGKTTIYGFVVDESTPVSQTVLLLIAVTVMLIPAAILMKAAENYFKHELEDGTPFTVEGAERIKKLGIMTIIMPTAAEMIVQIMAKISTNASNLEVTSGGSIITGLLLIFLHFVFRYGAEISASGTAAVPAVSDNSAKSPTDNNANS